MKPSINAVGESKSLHGFDVDRFVTAIQSKVINTRINHLTPNKAKHQGLIDHKKGRPVRYPENQHYLDGYNSFEPLIITRRRDGKKPQYTVADVDYHTELTDLPEWFNSPSEALYYARAVENKYKVGFGWRIIEYHQNNKSFEQKVAEDLRVKSDVNRLYQSTITGELSTSVDGGVTWFDGGIMDYPKMPSVEIREYCYRLFQEVGVHILQAHSRYLTRSKPLLDELKKGSFKLKPPRPAPPKFDELEWLNDEWVWYQYHIKQHEECNLEWLHGDDWHCDCYRTKVADYQKAVKQYEKAIEKWLEL